MAVPSGMSGLAKSFNAPSKQLGDLGTDDAASVVAATSDIALIVDRDGIVRDVVSHVAQLPADTVRQWHGRAWLSTVKEESRAAIQSILEEAMGGVPPRRRQVAHVTTQGVEVPVAYSALKAGSKGRILAVGHDRSSQETLQQRLIDAEVAVDRGYAKLRRAEGRGRLLFHSASEAMLFLDSATLRVVEANPAATQLLGLNSRRAAGRPFADFFDAGSNGSLVTMLATAGAGGRGIEVRAKLADGSREVTIAASLLREDRTALLLVRASRLAKEDQRNPMQGTRPGLVDLAEASLDGFLVTDATGVVLTVNPAFLDLVQVATVEQACGVSLESWLGRPGIDLKVLLSSLRDHGSVRLFTAVLQGNSGSTVDVEICAVSLRGSAPPCYGFTIRDVGPRVKSRRTDPPLTRTVEQLTELVGRVPLKDIVSETSEIIERHCIEAALKLSGDNRAATAEMLGLSRQSLYVKMRRYRLGDLVNATGEF